MKLHRSIFLLSALALVGLVSCESSTGIQQPQQQTYKLEINPDTLVTELFKGHRFRARVNGFSSADLRFAWHVNGALTSNGEFFFDRSFSDTGSFTISAKAYDSFNDTLVAEGFAYVYVLSPGATSISLSPNAIDTTCMTSSTGMLDARLTFQSTITPQYEYAYYTWHITGPGTDSIISKDYLSSLTFNFALYGDYVVTVHAQKGGLDFGSDTSYVRIGIPDLKPLIEQSKKVTVYLTLDTTHPVYSKPFYENPLAVGLPLISDATHSYSLTPTSFFARYNTETGIGTNNYNKADDKIEGAFSSDQRSVTSVSVSVDDTSYYYLYSPYDPTIKLTAARYGFKLQDLRLRAVSSTEIVYSSGGRPLSEFLSDISFYYNYEDYGPCGEVTTPYLHFKSEPTRAYATIVISR
jgi:hypothetical protein